MKPLVLDGIKQNLYLIEEDGRIYSNYKKDYLKLKKDKDGYLRVNLQSDKIKQNKSHQVRKSVSQLVLRTYIGPPPSDMNDPTVNHIDGNILNNHYTNLEWMERKENSKIRFNTGKGIKNPEAKLAEQQVIEICELLINTNLTLKEIAVKYNVEKSTISNIYRKKNWKEISEKYDFSVRQTIRNERGQYEVINTKLTSIEVK